MLTRRTLAPFLTYDGGEPAGGNPEPPAPTPEPTPAPPAPTPPAPAHDDSAFARMRREKEAAEREAQQAREALAERDRKEAEEQGRWKDIAEQEKARADKLEADAKAKDDQRNAERAARDLKFKDPEYALYLLRQNGVDISDPVAVKAGLEEIAKTRTDLIGTAPPAPPSGGAPGGNPPEPAGLTAEQLRAMSPQQIAALDPKVVNAALTS